MTDIEKAIAVLTEVVNEAGRDYVYPRLNKCVYVHEGKPDCIAARALVKLGVPLSILAGQEDVSAISLALTGQPNDVLLLLDIAQGAQDEGRTWGEALDLIKGRLDMKAYREDDTEVKPGDTIFDFRGDAWTFVQATRVREDGKSGKVIVSSLGQTREFYDRVFNLIVREN